MTAFQPESLAFDTIFDGPVDSVAIPSTLDKVPPAVFIDEGFTRPSRIFARFRGGRGTLAIRMDVPEQGVRLSIPVRVDDFSMNFLRRIAAELEEADDIGQHRTFVVSVQGRPRSVGVFLRTDADDSLGYRIQVDLTPEEIGPEGVVFIDFDELDVSWTAPEAFAEPLVGLGLRKVILEERPADPLFPSVSGLRTRHGVDYVPAELGFFALNPGGRTGPVVLSLQSIAARPDLGVRVRSRMLREIPRRLAVETQTVGGERATFETVRDGKGRWVVELPASAEPRLIRPSIRGAWRVEVQGR